MIDRVLACLAAFAAVAALGACVTVFPKTPPSQLYRFDTAIQPTPASGAPVTIRAGMIDFDPASAGDRILTVEGEEVAYVQGGRWAIPASELFRQAVEHGFNASGALRLVDINEAAQAKFRLRLQVLHFEARYLAGPKAAPTVVVSLRATLDPQGGGAAIEQPFEASVAASDNRLSAIVQAYDQAVSKVVGDLVAWVGQSSAA